jgi:hypothetical protein
MSCISHCWKNDEERDRGERCLVACFSISARVEALPAVPLTFKSKPLRGKNGNPHARNGKELCGHCCH